MEVVIEPNTLNRIEDLPQPAPGDAGGLAGPLDGDGKLPADQLPDMALTDVYVVADQTERLALSATVGDAAIQTDTNSTYLLQSEPASVNGNWVMLPVQPQTTSTHGGAGNAGKLLALDGSGLADGRNLQADGAVLDARTAVNTPSTIVARDSSGNFAAGTITASLTGTASGNDVLGSAASALSAALSALSSHVNNTVDAHLGTAIGYTPAVSGNWSPAPTTASGALDQAAARVKALESGTGNVTAFNGRTGAVSPADGDYAQNDITGLKTSSSPSFVTVTSTVATGTAPLAVSSTTKVTNLNADLLDGFHASQTAASATIPVSASGSSQIAPGFVASGTASVGRVPVVQGDGSVAWNAQSVTTSEGLSGGTGNLVYELAGAPVTLADNEAVVIPVGSLADPRIDVTLYTPGVARTNQVNSSIDFATEADYVQEDATNGTDVISDRVLLHRSLSDTRIKFMLQGNGAASDVPFEPFLHVLGGSGFAVSTTSPKYGSGCVNVNPGSGIQVDTTGDVPSGWGSYSWTIEAWVRFDALTGFRGIWCSNTSSYNTMVPTAFLLAMNGTGLYFFSSDNNMTWSFANNLLVKTGFSTGTWYHLAIDYAPADDEMHVYVDGVVEATVTGVTGLYSSDKYLSIGYWNYLADRFDGQYDDMRITVDAPENPPIYGGMPFTPPAEFTDPSFPTTGYYVYTGAPLAFPTARVDAFDSLTITQTVLGGSQVLYLVSWDGGSSWKDHAGNVVAIADINADGSTSSEMSTYFTALSVPSGSTDLRFAVGLQTSDSTLSPSVSQITFQYDEQAPWVPVLEADREVRVWLGDEGAVEVTNVSGGPLDIYAYARIM